MSDTLVGLPQWQALAAHRDAVAGRTLADLFADDPDRAARFSHEAASLFVDFSKQRITGQTMRLLLELAQARKVAERRDTMFAGQAVNVTENRAALHVALRAPRGAVMTRAGENVVPKVHEVLDRMAAFADAVRDGRWTGHSGAPIRNVISIGIGGSYLGPVMACEALRAFSRRDMAFRFVSNVDGSDLVEATRDLDPAETLFVVCSKTFTTLETRTNADAARAWCLAAFGDEAAVARHFAAVSADSDEMREFGIDPARMFSLWDWVGGRYSMDSAIGLSTMIAIGPENFTAMLAGFHAMDDHFRHAAPEHNLPLLMGLIGVWNSNFLGAQSVAVLPYAQAMKRFPAYLQQLAMESNGKGVTVRGMPVDYDTGAIFWGEPGVNGQHSFYQLLHQGTRLVPCDFIGFCQPLSRLGDQHDLLMANMFAQGEALAFGRGRDALRSEGTPEWLIPHRLCPGNRPSTTILAGTLDPRTLGALVALYEHMVFTQGVIWGIDSFDQWGVELGKTLATRIRDEIRKGKPRGHDPSTMALIRRYLAESDRK